jgi:hypothetical protein
MPLRMNGMHFGKQHLKWWNLSYCILEKKTIINCDDYAFMVRNALDFKLWQMCVMNLKYIRKFTLGNLECISTSHFGKRMKHVLCENVYLTYLNRLCMER